LREKDRKNGVYPVYGSNGIIGFHDDFLVETPFIVIGRKGSAGAVTFSKQNGFPIDTTFYIDKIKKSYSDKVLIGYLGIILEHLGFEKIVSTALKPGLNRNETYKVKIPIPPIELQKQIIEQSEKITEALNGLKYLQYIARKYISEIVESPFNQH